VRYNFCETGLGQYKNSHFRHEISDQLLIFWPLFNLPTTFAKRSRAKAPDATANSGMPKIPALRSLISAPISHQKVRKKVEKKTETETLLQKLSSVSGPKAWPNIFMRPDKPPADGADASDLGLTCGLCVWKPPGGTRWNLEQILCKFLAARGAKSGAVLVLVVIVVVVVVIGDWGTAKKANL